MNSQKWLGDMPVAFIDKHALYNGDCLDVLADLPENMAQLTVTSPPYAFGKEYEEGMTEEELSELIHAVAPPLLRVTKPRGFCFINFQQTTRHRHMAEQMYADAFQDVGWIFHSRRVWDKTLGRTKSTPSSINLSIPQAQFENLFTFRKPPNKKEEGFDRKIAVRGIWCIEEIYGWSTIEKGLTLGADVQPAQFSVELPILAIRLWSEPGDIVLDPFAGVFTTVIAAHHEGRIGVGIEKEEKYFEVGVKRVNDYVSQQSMFSVKEVS